MTFVFSQRIFWQYRHVSLKGTSKNCFDKMNSMQIERSTGELPPVFGMQSRAMKGKSLCFRPILPSKPILG
jgi:hypothetical protein